MTPIGPGVDNCNRLQLSDPLENPIERLELYIVSDTIRGIQIETSTRLGSVGDISSSETVKYLFTKENPLVGIFGFTGDSYINGLGVIRFDTECQAAITKQQQLESNLKRKSLQTEPEDNKTVLIALIAAGGILITAIIIVTVICIRRKKR